MGQRRRVALTITAAAAAGLAVAGLGGAGQAYAGPGASPPRDSGTHVTIPQDNAGQPCPTATVEVHDATGLAQALRTAGPGTVIALAEGIYQGRFTLSARGTPKQPIWICGGNSTVLDGGDSASGYALHLDGVSDVHIQHLTVRHAQKGIVVDRSNRTRLAWLTVTDIGDEAIHLRRNTTDSTITDCIIGRTGLRESSYGEGVYIGTAVAHWCEVNQCQPDRSDRNTITHNAIGPTTAEGIDIKEGATEATITANLFVGDSGQAVGGRLVDVKGNRARVTANVTTPRADAHTAVEVHLAAPGWGLDNHIEQPTQQPPQPTAAAPTPPGGPAPRRTWVYDPTVTAWGQWQLEPEPTPPSDPTTAPPRWTLRQWHTATTTPTPCRPQPRPTPCQWVYDPGTSSWGQWEQPPGQPWRLIESHTPSESQPPLRNSP